VVKTQFLSKSRISAQNEICPNEACPTSGKSDMCVKVQTVKKLMWKGPTTGSPACPLLYFQKICFKKYFLHYMRKIISVVNSSIQLYVKLHKPHNMLSFHFSETWPIIKALLFTAHDMFYILTFHFMTSDMLARCRKINLYKWKRCLGNSKKGVHYQFTVHTLQIYFFYPKNHKTHNDNCWNQLPVSLFWGVKVIIIIIIKGILQKTERESVW